MKKQHLILLCGAVAVSSIGLMIAANKLGVKTESGYITKNDEESDEYADYVTYEADFKDGYKLYFDYKPDLGSYSLTDYCGMKTVSFYQGTNLVMVTHTPAKLRNTSNILRTEEEFIDAHPEAEFCDALPYRNGDTKGYAYWYKEKIAGCNQGYYLFDGDDSFLIVVHGSGNDWPSNIQNVRIVKE